ncbi:extracellular solute-binding protein family 1 [Beutenbergia cavernae DSM 12333]|uniref:Extracellular solute-binding protein family 1 n=1 Tax=Beutenbergia cavernae (strain ATCC BAA-8 / DSM 12333 / CCUG 43141 / JCM 11478 / NBRC 16432 / NCIMB 13614 / HKI 0122) TaxID=471853 RepID=C5C205_BEUC1|nr:extracellular solute-binding protein [Beutenbergia cavernae]ACQ81630.1 extracellular solute-binding protein family 1 [Beutenbergia cavernae DSM 12333]
MSSTLSRRTFFGVTGALGTMGLAAACSSGGSGDSGGDSDATSGGERGSGILPTYQPNDSFPPDLASDNADVSPAYFTYPDPPQAVTDGAPGSGGSISALTFTYDPVAPELNSNALWQNLNEALGVELDLQYTPAADYDARFATTIAGNDLPDLVAIKGAQQQMPALLAAKFTDLSEHLAGDAVLDYPNLAALPTPSWLSTVYEGKIWGVPVPRSLIGTVLYTRADLLEQAGLSLQPESLEEFIAMAEALTDERSGKWAFGQTPINVMLEVNGVANGWSVDDAGTFTYNSTRPEYEQALADALDLNTRGVVHPDGNAAQNTQRNEWMMAGTTAFQIGGYAGWGKFYVQGAGIDGFRLTGMLSPAREAGGTMVRAAGNPASHFSAIAKQDDPERLLEILRVLDWLAAPFGSSEYVTRRFGVEGETFNFDGPDPVLTSAGVNQATLPVRYVTENSPVIYEANNEQAVQDQFDFQEAGLQYTVPDPTVGLYSETAVSSGAGPSTELNDVQTEILLGNQPVSTWAPAVEKYMAAAGDAIKAEYEEAWAQLNG